MSKDNKDKKSGVAGKVVIGTAVAAAAGYVAGILTAPKSGKETREDIKNKAVETYQAAEKELKKLHTELNELLEKAGDKASQLKDASGKRLEEAVDYGKKAKEKAREMISSLHEGGETNDKDLKKAIAEASKAIEDLKTYLKK